MADQNKIDFVLRYYQQGKLDTQQALKAVLERLKTNEQRANQTVERAEQKNSEQTTKTSSVHLFRMSPKPSVRRSSRLRYAAAVAVLCVLVGTAFALFYHPSGQSIAEPPAVATQHPASTAQPQTFHFDDTPINDVLAELNDAYGANLQASDTTKHLTGDFEADDLPMLIDMIEQTLGIEIINNEK